MSLVSDQRIAYGIRFTELTMGLEAVTADAQDLGIELFERCQIALKSLEFAGSDRGEICIVKGQHQVKFSEQLTDDDRSPGRFGAEQRY